jgi:hemolysin III
MQNPVRGFLHGSAAAAGLVGTIFLLFHAPNWPVRAAVLVFGLAMMALYTTSSLYHSIPWRERWKKRMQRMDHSMIYVLIAGTYTPVAAIVLDPPWNWIVLAMVWGITVGGVIQKGLFPKVPGWISVMMSTILGWIGIFFFWPMIQRLGWLPVGIVLAGGLLYTIGMVFLVTNRPRLWPRVFSYHEVFHVMVVSATSLHYLVIWRYVVPFAAT